jgi:lipid-A-disaccharide synthase
MSQVVADKLTIAQEAADDRDGLSVLFTAFEPSGDAHAAPVIRALAQAAPNLKIYAWGGPKMEEAGATVLERTTEGAAMGIGSASRIMYVRKQIRAIRRWSQKYRVIAHVAVDSPAANFPVCKVMKKRGAKIIHLVAPQMWAWGSWRVGKLRRLTDLVLCILPFEEQWFNERRVPARFIGHHVMNDEVDTASSEEQVRRLPQSSTKIAIFPGSRAQEVRANISMLVAAYTELQSRHNGVSGVIVAARPELAEIVRKKIKVFPHGLHVSTGEANVAIAWCDFAITVSGTVSLDITKQQKPMIAVYRTDPLSWLGSKLLLRTRYRLLPNIVAGREICPEFIPCLGRSMPIVNEATNLISDSKNLAIQREALRRVCLHFANKRPGPESAKLILELIRKGALAEPA